MSARRRAWHALLPCAALLGACADLPTIRTNSCGNGVIELGEDCDGFPIYSQASCRKPGEVGECHLDCSGDVKGERSSCPQGWGCDVNAICRAPSGNFSAAQTRNVGAVASLLSADFDGDGRVDVVSRAPLDRLARSRLSFHFFDAQGRMEETRELAKPVSPWLGQLSDDGRADLVFSETSVGLLLGRDDRRIVLEAFSSYRVPDTRLRLTGVYDGNVSGALSLVAFGTFAGQPGFSVPDLSTTLLRRLGTLAAPIDSRVVPVPGNVIEGSASPCDEIVLAVPDTSSFLLLDLCETASDGAVVWRQEALQHAIALTPPAQLDGRALIADVNDDRHLDLLLGTRDDAGEERAYVAYGDGNSLRDALPFTQRYWDTPRGDVEDRRLPLAVGDFSGDGWADLVYENHLVSSMPGPLTRAPRYEVVSGNISEPWTAAIVADVNNNGKDDVIVASRHTAGVDVFNGTGTPYLVPLTLPTEQPVQFLNVGDFDGDLTNDIAFVEQPVAGEVRAALSIAFGNIGRPPTAPQLIATVQEVEQMSGFRQWARANILLASAHGDPVAYSGIVTLEGTADRIPFAPYQLVTFTTDGSFSGFPALHVLGGSFRGAGKWDVLALDSNAFAIRDPQREQIVNRFWLFADIAQGERLPLPIGKLDSRLEPQGSRDGRMGLLASTQLQIGSCSVDLDNDQRAEAVWAIPTQDGHCGVSIISLSSADPPEVIARETLLLDQYCNVPTLASDDLNEDGAPDLLLSSVRTNSAGVELERSLWVLWNDRESGFSPERMSRVDDGDTPLAFATLPAVIVPNEGTIARSVVYITESGLMRKVWSQSGQRFARESHVPALQLSAGRALTSGDYNGDGADDLALVDGTKLMVFLAELGAP